MGYVRKEAPVRLDEKDEKDKIYDSVKSSVEIINIGNSVYSSRFHQGLGKCFTCDNALIMKTSRSNDHLIRCDVIYRGSNMVPHDVTECSGYRKTGEIGIWDLIKMYNIVDLSKPDAVMGFKAHEDPETPKL